MVILVLEATTEMSYSAKEENEKIKDGGELNSLTTATASPTLTINRKSATGSKLMTHHILNKDFMSLYSSRYCEGPT